MDISVDVNSLCASQNHIHMTVTVVKGGQTRTFPLTVTKPDILTLEDIEPDEIMLVLLRNFVKESGLSWGVQLRNAIEAKTWKL